MRGNSNASDFSLAVQWFTLCTSTAGSTGLIAGQELSAAWCMLHGVARKKKKKVEMLYSIWDSNERFLLIYSLMLDLIL